MNNKFSDYELSSIPNDNYRKLFDKFKRIETVQVSEWKKPEVLGYFCKKYYDYYQSKYNFKFNTPQPSKCFEIFMVSSLAGKLSSDPIILKNYIDWSFKEVVPKAKRKLTSISFLNKDDVLSFYKMNVLNFSSAVKINRASELNDDVKNLVSKFNLNIKTYGELAFLYNMENAPDSVVNLLHEVEKFGISKLIIESIV